MLSRLDSSESAGGGIELIRHDRRSMSGEIRQTEEEIESFRNRLERGFSGEGSGKICSG